MVVWQFTAFDVLANDVTKNPAKVFVARIRHERPGIGDHADET